MGIVLRSGSMVESCCVAVLAPLKVTNHSKSEDFQKAATLAVNWQKSQNALIKSLIPVQPNIELHRLPL